MSGPPPAVQGLEAEALAVVQDRGEASVRAVMDVLERTAAAPRAYTTYMTTLARLHKKGLLTRRREGKTDIYVAAHTREEYAHLRAAAEVEHRRLLARLN
jgi:predicted transcriptional regulator